MVVRSPRHRQRMIHQPGEELHRQVLEGERRPVKELEHEGVGADLRERRHGRMTECPIGLARHAGEIGFGDRAADERTHDLDRDLGIGPAREARDGVAIESRPDFRHVKAAVAGEPGERDVDKAERRGFAPGRDVAHRFRPRPQRLGAAAPGRSRRPQGAYKPIEITIVNAGIRDRADLAGRLVGRLARHKNRLWRQPAGGLMAAPAAGRSRCRMPPTRTSGKPVPRQRIPQMVVGERGLQRSDLRAARRAQAAIPARHRTARPPRALSRPPWRPDRGRTRDFSPARRPA